jgi:hypothetical protein
MKSISAEQISLQKNIKKNIKELIIMRTPQSNSANKILRVTKNTKTRLSIIALFVLIAVSSTAVFSATTSASSLDKFFENNLPAPIASGLSSVSHAFFGMTSTVSSAITMTATVTTDKNDYAPGETAVITGTGFGSGETVTLHVEHTDGTEPGGGGHEHWTAITDANGNFTTTWYVNPDDSGDSTFVLKAVGQTSGIIATTTFTDSVSSVSITSPTTASPASITSFSQPLTVNFTYSTTVATTYPAATADVSIKQNGSVLDTSFITRFNERKKEKKIDAKTLDLAMIAAALAAGYQQKTISETTDNPQKIPGRWALAGRLAAHQNRF